MIEFMAGVIVALVVLGLIVPKIREVLGRPGGIFP